MISNLVTDYIQKRRGEPGFFSFEYNLLQKLISNCVLHPKWLSIFDCTITCKILQFCGILLIKKKVQKNGLLYHCAHWELKTTYLLFMTYIFFNFLGKNQSYVCTSSTALHFQTENSPNKVVYQLKHTKANCNKNFLQNTNACCWISIDNLWYHFWNATDILAVAVFANKNGLDCHFLEYIWVLLFKCTDKEKYWKDDVNSRNPLWICFRSYTYVL